MKATLKVDTSEFQRQLRIYLKERGLGVKRGLSKQSGLLVKDMIKATPPIAGKTGGKGTFTQSFAAQRRAGKAAIKRDINKAFQPLKKGDKVMPQWLYRKLPKKARKYAKGYATDFAYRKIATILHRVKGGKGNATGDSVKEIKAVLQRRRKAEDEATERSHNKQRDRRTGRVHSLAPVFVHRRGSIAKLRKRRQDHVGKWKAGWVRAAQELKVRGIPRWVVGQPTRSKGRIKQLLQGANPSITVINRVRGEKGRNLNIARAAIQNRTRAMRKELLMRQSAASKKAKLSR